MISKEDIIALCGLTDDEVAAIAEHEHVPDITAAALADYLMHQPAGPERIRQMIIDDIRQALDRNDLHHAQSLIEALRHFVSEHGRELAC